MDIVTIAGLVLGIGMILGGNMVEGGHIESLIQGPAAMIVFGGAFGASILGFTPGDVKRAFKDLIICFKPPKDDHHALIESMVEMAKIARKDGLLALEKHVATAPNPFMKRYLQQIIDGQEEGAVRSGMETEMSLEEEASGVSAKVLEAGGGYAPTVGIIGAVLGLIHVMQNLDDPSKLGGGIATAFVATVYGVALANLICLPLANKLKRRIHEKMVGYQLMMDGLLALQAGDNPKVIGERLQVYLHDHKPAPAEPKE